MVAPLRHSGESDLLAQLVDAEGLPAPQRRSGPAVEAFVALELGSFAERDGRGHVREQLLNGPGRERSRAVERRRAQHLVDRRSERHAARQEGEHVDAAARRLA